MSSPIRVEAFVERMLRNMSIPIVVFDACAALDVIRAGNPAVKAPPASVIGDVTRLLDGASDPAQAVWLVTTRTVNVEVDENLTSTVREASNAALSLHHSLTRLDSAVGYLRTEHRTAEPIDVERRSTLATQLEAKVRELMATTSILCDDDSVILQRARERFLRKRPPSHIKDSRKDSELLENLLAMAGLLRERGFSQPVVFVSSNTKDFDPKSPQLADELTDASVKLLPNFTHAARFIGLS